jgi:hypothetical protein
MPQILGENRVGLTNVLLAPEISLVNSVPVYDLDQSTAISDSSG